jgi:hypothetical protein
MGEIHVYDFLSSSAKQNLCLVEKTTFDDGVHLLVSPRSDKRWGDEF